MKRIGKKMVRGYASSRRRRSMRRSVSISWKEENPNIMITADAVDFDPLIIEQLKEEGFGVGYLPHTGNTREYVKQLEGMEDSLEFGDRYALLAYGEAAALVLEACLKPMPKLCAVVAYYPTYLPPDGARFPPSLSLKVHLAGTQPFDGDTHCYNYKDSDVGFAQHDSDRYDPVSSRIAWTRTMGCLREGFEIKKDLEYVWDKHLHTTLNTKDVQGTMDNIVDGARFNYIPVLTGGIGHEELQRFYEEKFFPNNPPSLKAKLISRTIGTDQIVDEMYLTFDHTQEISWMLPDIPPTDRKVEVAVVSVVSIRGGKISHKNIYWDQASVLMQLGLLDPEFIPPSFTPASQYQGENNLERLPVVGAESARRLLEE